jgi:DMSO/TMAO reductase YedYZ heme-binding membrane subunit
LRKPLLQIRAELSIVASLLCIGHVVMYGRSYLEQLLSSMLEMPLARLLATLVAVLLVLLLIPLALTSFKAIRARMRPQSWRRLQRFAYLFFALIFVHILFYLLPPALAGSTGAAISLAVYLALGAIYAILRVRQALRPAPAVASSQLMS